MDGGHAADGGEGLHVCRASRGYELARERGPRQEILGRSDFGLAATCHARRLGPRNRQTGRFHSSIADRESGLAAPAGT